MEKLLIWGTGKIADRVIKHLSYDSVSVKGIIDSNKKKELWMGFPVYTPDMIPDNYDYIVVANSYTNEVVEICKKYNIDLNRLFFLRGLKYNPGCNDKTIAKLIFDDEAFFELSTEYGWEENSFFEEDLLLYSSMNPRANFIINEENNWPILNDKYKKAGQVDNYFWQDLWAAKHVHDSGVVQHFDIGSRLDGFITHLLSMGIHVTMIDVREFPCSVEGLTTIVDDATMLNNIQDGSLYSLSALCSLEHFGLGRYGDPIDPEACFKCFENISKKMKSGGHIYISVPIGKERVEFNAHRVFYPKTIIDSFEMFSLKEFSCVSNGIIEFNVDVHAYDEDNHNGDYRYGLFHFLKK